MTTGKIAINRNLHKAPSKRDSRRCKNLVDALGVIAMER